MIKTLQEVITELARLKNTVYSRINRGKWYIDRHTGRAPGEIFHELIDALDDIDQQIREEHE
jgi:hypothetical protein